MYWAGRSALLEPPSWWWPLRSTLSPMCHQRRIWAMPAGRLEPVYLQGGLQGQYREQERSTD